METAVPLKNIHDDYELYSTLFLKMQTECVLPEEEEEINSSNTTVGDAATAVVARQVQVNQRALIDKILARYASAGAVYRELLANSNDANATIAQIQFVTTKSSATATKKDQEHIVQVIYRNNGMVFRSQDWDRLQRIAEGNPDPSKVGAFGVGAYSMFSICEEPMIVSGDQALLFKWRGSTLWTQQVEHHHHDDTADDNSDNQDPASWTTFLLPLRDATPLTKKSIKDVGHFLCSSLTFADSLQSVQVFVNDEQVMSVKKQVVPLSTNAMELGGMESLHKECENGMLELDILSVEDHVVELEVKLYDDNATIVAHQVSALATTHLDASAAKELQRITKKPPPETVRIQLLQRGLSCHTKYRPSNKAAQIARSFVPMSGTTTGKIFIGFRTSQTTGYMAHLCAPFLPTVEREAIDLQHAVAVPFNTDLLECGGKLLRLHLERTMQDLGKLLEMEHQGELIDDDAFGSDNGNPDNATKVPTTEAPVEDRSEQKGTFAVDLGKSVWGTLTSTLGDITGSQASSPEDNPAGGAARSVSEAERRAILLMKSVCPRESTPEARVGTNVTKGFRNVLLKQRPPTLTYSGVRPGNEAKLPIHGLETFCSSTFPVVCAAVAQNCMEYQTGIARATFLDKTDLLKALQYTIFTEDELVVFLRWWAQYTQIDRVPNFSGKVRNSLRFYDAGSEGSNRAHRMQDFTNCLDFKDPSEPVSHSPHRHLSAGLGSCLHESLPLPATTLPRSLQDKIGTEILAYMSLKYWLTPLTVEQWITFFRSQRFICDGKSDEISAKLRMCALTSLYRYYQLLPSSQEKCFAPMCLRKLSNVAWIPFDEFKDGGLQKDAGVEIPKLLYLSGRQGVENIRLVSQSLLETLRQLGDDKHQFLQVCLGVKECPTVDATLTSIMNSFKIPDTKQLVSFLRNASLAEHEITRIKRNLRLGAQNDPTGRYYLRFLHLPREELRLFPFVKLLPWPKGEILVAASEDGQLLIKLGVQASPPPIPTLVEYVAGLGESDSEKRENCLSSICSLLDQHETVREQFHRNYRGSITERTKFLPCHVRPLTHTELQPSIEAPIACFSSPDCSCMGFPILNTKRHGKDFLCWDEPPAFEVFTRFKSLVAEAKTVLSNTFDSEESQEKVSSVVWTNFTLIFSYMSRRLREYDQSFLHRSLRWVAVIPTKRNITIEWSCPAETLFERIVNDPVAEALLSVTNIPNPSRGQASFVKALGVRDHVSTFSLCDLMTRSPQSVLDKLESDSLYLALLRRVAQAKIAPRCKLPFLLGYDTKRKVDGTEVTKYRLAKASDIFVVDHSFYGRMFPMLRAPAELDLEEFYINLGAKVLSREVKCAFDIEAATPTDIQEGTAVRKLELTLQEKMSLLVAPCASRPLAPRAAWKLDPTNLEIHTATNIFIDYSLDGRRCIPRAVDRRATTCCWKELANGRRAIYLTEDFDWFDVGRTIGEIILHRCHVEDAFFIGTLLETPLDRLRTVGFAVDRTVSASSSSTGGKSKAVDKASVGGRTNEVDNPTKADSASSSTGKTEAKGRTEAKSKEAEQEQKGCVDNEETSELLTPIRYTLSNFVSNAASSAASTAQSAVSQIPDMFHTIGGPLIYPLSVGPRNIDAGTLSEPLLEDELDEITRSASTGT